MCKKCGKTEDFPHFLQIKKNFEKDVDICRLVQYTKQAVADETR